MSRVALADFGAIDVVDSIATYHYGIVEPQNTNIVAATIPVDVITKGIEFVPWRYVNLGHLMRMILQY